MAAKKISMRSIGDLKSASARHSARETSMRRMAEDKALSFKTFGELTSEEKDSLLKVLFLRAGLIKPDSSSPTEGGSDGSS